MEAIGDLFRQLGDDFVRLQHTIDRAGLDRLSQYLPIWQAMRPAQPELADALIPSLQSLNEATVTLNFQVIRSRAREAGVDLSLLNLGYATKFELAQAGRCSIQIRLIRDNSNPRRPSDG